MSAQKNDDNWELQVIEDKDDIAARNARIEKYRKPVTSEEIEAILAIEAPTVDTPMLELEKFKKELEMRRRLEDELDGDGDAPTTAGMDSQNAAIGEDIQQPITEGIEAFFGKENNENDNEVIGDGAERKSQNARIEQNTKSPSLREINEPLVEQVDQDDSDVEVIEDQEDIAARNARIEKYRKPITSEEIEAILAIEAPTVDTPMPELEKFKKELEMRRRLEDELDGDGDTPTTAEMDSQNAEIGEDIQPPITKGIEAFMGEEMSENGNEVIEYKAERNSQNATIEQNTKSPSTEGIRELLVEQVDQDDSDVEVIEDQEDIAARNARIEKYRKPITSEEIEAILAIEAPTVDTPMPELEKFKKELEMRRRLEDELDGDGDAPTTAGMDSQNAAIGEDIQPPITEGIEAFMGKQMNQNHNNSEMGEDRQGDTAESPLPGDAALFAVEIAEIYTMEEPAIKRQRQE